MPASEIDALLGGAVAAIEAALVDDENRSAQWQVAVNVLTASQRNPPAGLAAAYELAIDVLADRLASADPDEARWASSYACEWAARNPTP